MDNDSDIKIYIVMEADNDVIKGVYIQRSNAESCFNSLKVDSDINYVIHEHIIQDFCMELVEEEDFE